MIHLLYNIALWLAFPFLIAYHLYRSTSRGRRPAFAERFGSIAKGKLAALEGERPIWVHAVSVGETNAVKPLLKALKERYPERKIVISNVTETGRSVALTIAEADLCIYFPFDYRFAVRRLLARIRPALILVVETEIWPNFLRAAREMGMPAVMVNGRISDRSFGRYLRLRWFFSRVLGDFARFCMQTGEDARRIVAMGAPSDRVEVTRNLKYDLPVASFSPTEKAEMRGLYRIPAGLLVLTGGSTHQGEEEAMVAAYRRLIAEGRELLLVLAPRHPERVPQVAEILRREGVPLTLRSLLTGRSEPFRSGEALLVDTVGELMRFYAVSDLVFVGGSLVPTGGHNILEPASLRVPVLFGPYMSNFRESAALVLEYGGGRQIQSGDELAAALASLLDDGEERRTMGENGARLMEENGGATLRHL
ncbi:MAG TPA: 3-deoxy-D-manno-octulosonic acid transferase, partial [Geobacteraceae bacterium]|nr:3-deoxy-D-manno-octulosonic acid transferase [Geobacteraceae bacterium]